MSRNKSGLRRASMRGRALRKGCVVRSKNSLDIFNIKKFWGVLVIANFGYTLRQGRALLGTFPKGAVPMARCTSSVLTVNNRWGHEVKTKGAPFAGRSRGRGLRVLEDRSDVLLKRLMGQGSKVQGAPSGVAPTGKIIVCDDE